MRVRTDWGALISGAVIAGVLSVTVVGNGKLPQALNEPVAGQAAPTAGTAAAAAIPPAEAPTPSLPRPEGTLDSFVLQGLRGGLTYIALFLAAHFGLCRVSIGGRWPYAGAGALCALISVATQTPLGGWRVLAEHGTFTEYFAIVLGAGAILGFIYQWRAGLEAEGDDPALLQQTLDARAREAASSGVSRPMDNALVDTGQAEYFDGPLQVRTALPLAFVAALVSAGAYALIRMAIGTAGEMTLQVQHHPGAPFNQMIGIALQSQLDMLLFAGLWATIPFSIVVFLGHLGLKAINKTSPWAYLIAGACAPLTLLLLLGPTGLLIGLQAAVPCAIAMCVYRNMAGLEPKPVASDIIVRDRRDLVGEAHPRRQFGRLIKR